MDGILCIPSSKGLRIWSFYYDDYIWLSVVSDIGIPKLFQWNKLAAVLYIFFQNFLLWLQDFIQLQRGLLFIRRPLAIFTTYIIKKESFNDRYFQNETSTAVHVLSGVIPTEEVFIIVVFLLIVGFESHKHIIIFSPEFLWPDVSPQMAVHYLVFFTGMRDYNISVH